MGPVFRSLDAIAAQTDEQKNSFALLGVPEKNITVTGNLKADLLPAAGSGDRAIPEGRGFRSGSRVVVAGSTHEGEEEAFARNLGPWRKTAPFPVLVVAPRDPVRARAVKKLFRDSGFNAVLYTDDADLEAADVIVVDRMGTLARLYALADICFVGGSLVPEGGHNPLEPAACGKPVLFGPDMGDFPEISRDLARAGGAWRVRDAQELGRAVKTLLNDESKAREMGKSARLMVENNRGATERTMAVLARTLGPYGQKGVGE